MNAASVAVVVLGVLEAGFMVFDGVRALTVGDYVTPKTGPYAGQLGPWAKVVSAVGVEPRSRGMKVFFVAYGVAWLGMLAAFLAGAAWAPTALLVAAAGALWYAVPGTVQSVLQIGLLLWLRQQR